MGHCAAVLRGLRVCHVFLAFVCACPRPSPSCALSITTGGMRDASARRATRPIQASATSVSCSRSRTALTHPHTHGHGMIHLNLLSNHNIPTHHTHIHMHMQMHANKPCWKVTTHPPFPRRSPCSITGTFSSQSPSPSLSPSLSVAIALQRDAD